VAVLAQAQHDVDHGVAGDVLDGVGHLPTLALGHGLLHPGHGFVVRQALGRTRQVVEEGVQHAHGVQVAGHECSDGGASCRGHRKRKHSPICGLRRTLTRTIRLGAGNPSRPCEGLDPLACPRKRRRKASEPESRKPKGTEMASVNGGPKRGAA